MAKLTFKIEYDKEDNNPYMDEDCYYADITYSVTLPPTASIKSLYTAFGVFADAIGYDGDKLKKMGKWN